MLEGHKEMVENKIHTIVGKLSMNAGWTSIPVRMSNDNIRWNKFKYMYIKIICISEF